VQKKLPLFEVMASEVNPRFMAGLLFILVLLLHSWVIVWLLQPTEPDPLAEPLKVIEVALLPSPSPKAAIAPPAPPKPAPPKKVPPKKQPVKQPVKKKVPVISKPVEQPKPQPVVDEQLPTPPPLFDSVQKPKPPTTGAQPAANKSGEKTGSSKADTKTVISGVVPLLRVPPKYPMRAANRHIEGWVKIEFTITTTGTVTDAVVVDAQPADVFNDTALDAIKKWKFKEKIVNGVAVTQRAVQILQFKLLN